MKVAYKNSRPAQLSRPLKGRAEMTHAGTEAAVRDHIQAQLKEHQHEMNDQGCYLLRRCLRAKRQDVRDAGLEELLREVGRKE